jgi:hypothetical protein
MSKEVDTLQVSVLPYSCSICPPLVNPDKSFSHMLDSLGLWPQPTCSFRSVQAVTPLYLHVPLTNSFVHRRFCVAHGPKPQLNRHDRLSFDKFQDTQRFLIPCPRHVSSRLPPTGETYKYAKAPITQTNLDRICTF